MIELLPRQGLRQVLCLGAHSDDIEIGCGGTLLRWLEEQPELEVHWVVFCAPGERANEARKSAERFLGEHAAKRLRLFEFRDGFLPYQGADVKDAFESLKVEFQPDLVFTHTRGDLHQDHRSVCELTWNTFRDHWILEYEIPKWDGDLGASVPNAFVALDERHLERKIENLLAVFGSQRSKAWFDAETFRGLARLRGVECRARYAEAFVSRKFRIGS